MRTALLVYSGISLKMMVDSDLGAVLHTMFMVQYEPDGVAGPHDHPLEEAYLITDGEVDATFDGAEYRLQAGDIAWAGVGCVHSFRATGAPVRWVETQSPQMPPGTPIASPATGTTSPPHWRTPTMSERTIVVVGGTSGIGRELAASLVARGDRVILTGRDAGRAASVAAELGDRATGIALSSPSRRASPPSSSPSARCTAWCWRRSSATRIRCATTTSHAQRAS